MRYALDAFWWATFATALACACAAAAMWWVLLAAHRAAMVGENSRKECAHAYLEYETPGSHLRRALLDGLQTNFGRCMQALVYLTFALVLALLPLAVPLAAHLARKVPWLQTKLPAGEPKPWWPYLIVVLAWFSWLWYTFGEMAKGPAAYTPFVNVHQLAPNADVNKLWRKLNAFGVACAALLLVLQFYLFSPSDLGVAAGVWLATRFVLLGLLAFGGAFAIDVLGKNDAYTAKLKAANAALLALPRAPVIAHLQANYYQLHGGPTGADAEEVDMAAMLKQGAGATYATHAEGRELETLAGAHPAQVAAFRSAMAAARRARRRRPTARPALQLGGPVGAAAAGDPPAVRRRGPPGNGVGRRLLFVTPM
jgi:hypothetical protein